MTDYGRSILVISFFRWKDQKLVNPATKVFSSAALAQPVKVKCSCFATFRNFFSFLPLTALAENALKEYLVEFEEGNVLSHPKLCGPRICNADKIRTFSKSLSCAFYAGSCHLKGKVSMCWITETLLPAGVWDFLTAFSSIATGPVFA